MQSRLKVEIDEKDGIGWVRLAGVVDESSELLEQFKQLAAETLIVNLAEIEGVNSVGIRYWYTWLEQQEGEGRKIFFLNCPPILVIQASMIKNFFKTGRVVSFFLPYYCEKCNIETNLLMYVDEAPEDVKAGFPVSGCERCGGEMVFNEFDQVYLLFLKGLSRAPLDPALKQLILSFSNGDSKLG